MLSLALLAATSAAPALAQSPAPSAGAEPPPRVRELLDLLGDPGVRDWLEAQRTESHAAAPAAPSEEARIEGYFATPVAAIRQHFASLAAAFPMLPADFEQARARLVADLQDRGLVEILFLLCGFVALGFGAEWLFWRVTVAAHERIRELDLATVGDRLRAVATRLAFGTGLVIAFALGSVVSFLPFHWPPLLREIVLGYLLAFLAMRLALVIGRVLLAPGGRYGHDVERFRIIPMSTTAARFWYPRLGLLVAWFACWLGHADPARCPGLLARGPAPGRVSARTGPARHRARDGLAPTARRARRRPSRLPAGAGSAAASVTCCSRGISWLLWTLWVAGAMPVFWLAVLAVALPAAISVTQRSVNHILRPPGVEAGAGLPSVRAVCLERGLRAALIIGAALLLAHAWQIDLVALTASDTMLTRLVRGVLSAVVILLLADLAWHRAQNRDRPQARGRADPGSAEHRRGEAPRPGADAPADPAQRPVRHPDGHGGDDGPLGARRGDRAA